MDFSPEQLTGFIAIGFGCVRVFEWGAKSLYVLATGKKDSIHSMEEMLSKATTNHLSHLQGGMEKLVELTHHSISQHEIMIKQGEQQICTHEKQIELLGTISGKLSK